MKDYLIVQAKYLFSYKLLIEIIFEVCRNYVSESMRVT